MQLYNTESAVKWYDLKEMLLHLKIISWTYRFLKGLFGPQKVQRPTQRPMVAVLINVTSSDVVSNELIWRYIFSVVMFRSTGWGVYHRWVIKQQLLPPNPDDTAACWGWLAKTFHLQMTSFAKLAIGANVKCPLSNSASGGLTMTMRPLFKASLLTSKDSKWRWVTTLNRILVSHQTHVARERSNLICARKRYDKGRLTNDS